MSLNKCPDFLIIGAGIVGLTIALELKKQFSDSSITILEKEVQPGAHASGRNSGVLHAGFYYTADSLKAQLCRDGNLAWRQYCKEKKLTINQCGKLVIARNENELKGLDELYKRGHINNVELEMISAKQAAEIESQMYTYERALWSPTTATVNPMEVVQSIQQDIAEAGISLLNDTAYIERVNNRVITSNGEFEAGYIINAAGLYADKIAKDYGFSQDFKILPFKGLYLYANDDGLKLKTNIYPVPDLRNPFLGVHFTVTAENKTKIGPTAIPAFWRENYVGLEQFNLKEMIDILGIDASLFVANNFGFRKLAFNEMQKYSKKKLVKLAGTLLKNIDQNDFKQWGKPGIRAQLINIKTKELEMDFKFEGDDKSFHVLNAVSPAFTCALPFSELLVSEMNIR
ncbi:MAG TPA: L-2-hydroxyglutarate oxidase [Thiotrichaceae bacterium]|jgi:L-2-hydroxyglutarate oxidase LhgO|nr:L-2-hydroxyglutarate oxidase [Thiotrichaceae bacterium]HIM06981.1 L-2-hydroxyglutarate oxidase [Gammaproteobacteria bacterium]